MGYRAPARSRYALGGQSPHNWTGFYAGLNAGAAWGKSKATTTTDCSAPASGYICDQTGGTVDAAALNASGTGTISDTGFTGGVQAGYNWQQSNLIYGFEADFGAFSLSGSRTASGVFPGGGDTLGFVGSSNYSIGTSVDSKWLATFRGRFGIALPSNLLVYATGGLALTRISVSFNYSDSSPVPSTGAGSASQTKTGWALGGGLEWALDNHWSVKGEYLYVDFGSVTASGFINNVGGGYNQGISTSADLRAHIARLGVNYKF